MDVSSSLAIRHPPESSQWIILANCASLGDEKAAISWLAPSETPLLVVSIFRAGDSLSCLQVDSPHSMEADHVQAWLGDVAGVKHWHLYSDTRCDGWNPPDAIKLRFKNLHCVGSISYTVTTVSDLLSSWSVSSADPESRGTLVVPAESADQIIQGSINCLTRLEEIIIIYANRIADKSFTWLQDHGFSISHTDLSISQCSLVICRRNRLGSISSSGGSALQPPSSMESLKSDLACVNTSLLTLDISSHSNDSAVSRPPKALKEGANPALGLPSSRFAFDYEFYVGSYPDIAHLTVDESIRHFNGHGFFEGRYCSFRHYVGQFFPAFSGCIDWRAYQASLPSDCLFTPLELAERLATVLTIGTPSCRDLSLHGATKLPAIAKHGGIFAWAQANYNSSSYRVLEIGSRSVISNRLREQFIPECDYTGFDILGGDNVNIIGDVHALSDHFSAGSFDLVISHAVFEHLAMPWVAAEEITRVLKIGGCVAIETHFSFSEHELPWHFFQFNANALEVLFGKGMGYDIVDSGHDNQIVGRYAQGAAGYLEGKPVGGLFCHSAIISRKVFDVFSAGSSWSWKGAYSTVVGSTMYPSSP